MGAARQRGVTLLLVTLSLMFQLGYGWVGFVVEARRGEAGGGRILRTADAGNSWDVIHNETWCEIEYITQVDSNDKYSKVIAVGYNDTETCIYSMDFTNSTRNTNLYLDSNTILGDEITSSRLQFSTINHPSASVLPVRMRSVACSSPDLCVAVGHTTTILTSTDRGLTWTEDGNLEILDLNDVALAKGSGNGTIGYIVGNVGFLLKTHDGGINWAVAADKNQFFGYTNSSQDLYSVHMFKGDPNKVYVVGSFGFQAMSNNGGSTFTAAQPITSEHLYRVDFWTDGLSGVAAGNAGIIIYTSDGGVTWQHSNINYGQLPVAAISALQFINPMTVFAAYRNRLFRSNNAGVNFEILPTISSDDETVNALTSFFVHSGAFMKLHADYYVSSFIQGFGDGIYDISFTNSGTEPLTINSVDMVFSDALEQDYEWVNGAPVGTFLPGASSSHTLHYFGDGMNQGNSPYRIDFTFHTNEPTYTTSLDTILFVSQIEYYVSEDFMAVYWWIFPIIAGSVTLFILWMARSRYVWITAYNRKHPAKYRLSFWKPTSGPCATTKWHADHSEFWMHQYDSDEDFSSEFSTDTESDSEQSSGSWESSDGSDSNSSLALKKNQ